MKSSYTATTALAAVIALAMAGNARAQDANETDRPDQAEPMPAGTGAPEILVTAQRRTERLRDVPISMTVVTSDNLQSAGVVDTAGLERVTPGLTMQRQNGYVNPSLRGISTSVVTAGAENPVAIYLDGVYVSNMGSSVFALPDVEQVEVLKGPQGTLFGRNATGGAIRITTKTPSFVPTGKVEVMTGFYPGAAASQSAYDLAVRGFVSGPIVNDTVAASVAFSMQKSNGYGVNVAYGQVSEAVDRVYGSDRLMALEDKLLRGKLYFEPSSNFSLLLTGYWTDTHSSRNQGGYLALNGTALTPGELSFPDRISPVRPWESSYDSLRPHTTSKTRGASMVADIGFDGIGTVTSTTAYAWSKYSEWNDSEASYIPGCLAAFACTAPFDSIRDRSFQQELLFSSEKFGPFSFVAGANYYKANAQVYVMVNDFTYGPDPLGEVQNPPLFFYTQTVRTDALGFFFEGSYDLTDRLHLSAGIRYSDEKKTGVLDVFGGLDFTTFEVVNFLPPDFALTDTKAKKWTPRASLRYELDDRSNVYFTFSQGFKSGIIPGGAPGAAEVKPEQITAYELGLKTAQPGYNLNAAIFYYDYKDIQVQTNGGAGGVVNIVDNAAKARIYGLDLDGSFDLTDAFTVRGGVSWIPYAKYLEYPGAPVNLPRPIDPADPLNTDVTGGDGVFVPGQGIDLSGTRLFKTPKLTVSMTATYAIPTSGGEVTVSPNLYYASKLCTEPTHLADLCTDNLKVNLEIAYEQDDGPWRFALWGRNLTNDDSFVSVSNNGSGVLLMPGDPLEVGLTSTFSF
ncbi:TonB-dependent receptor [Croceicoccus mobilis]|uniref:TonB-dependent receptor n=1 Tax=Croceicoccus mobilis TaxID=1703339 RepID=A0A916Z7N2_9SPHN|nr:TonB-dependent receptor [Croceicoccus mobilis]GGD80493.1 TonB-dependent receptor [Croceicoccus mobilis]